jgi:hypothetical protein
MITTKKYRSIFSILVLAAVLLSACGATDTEPTATPFSVEAVYTSAAETLSAQLTEAAKSMPSATITVTPSTTNTPKPTETLQVGPTNTTGFIVINTAIPLVTYTPGPSPTPTGSATSRTLGCHDSTFISHITFPDNTVVQPGHIFTKIWEIKNSGSGACAWTNDYRLVFVGGDTLGGDSTRISQKVGVGATARVRLNDLTAPTAPGTYTSQWRMATANWEPFGAVLTIIIKVPGPTHTPVSPTVTNTPAPPTATNTTAPPTSTNTPEPSPTSTNTTAPPTSTNTPEPSPTITPFGEG